MSHDFDGQVGMEIKTPMDVVRALNALSHRAWQAAATARIIGDDECTDEKIAAMGISVFVDDMGQRLQEIEKRTRELFGMPEYGLTDPRENVVHIQGPTTKRAAKGGR